MDQHGGNSPHVPISNRAVTNKQQRVHKEFALSISTANDMGFFSNEAHYLSYISSSLIERVCAKLKYSAQCSILHNLLDLRLAIIIYT